MNAEVHKIIEHMQQLAPPTHVQVSDYDRVHIYQMLNMARLLVLLAEEQEKAALKMEQLTTQLVTQTAKLINFTNGLYWLTAALFVLALVQSLVAFAFHR